MKEVKKKIGEQFLLNLLKQGKNPSTISDELNIPKQNINYHLRKLKDQGIIKRVGYGVWEVKNITLNIHPNKPREIRGHAFIWIVKPKKQYNWIKILKNYKLIRNLIPRLIINNKKVWFGKKTLTVYENKSFYAKDSVESRKYAVISLRETLEKIENQFKINLKPFKFKPAKEHYGMIKNDLARQYNRQGKKLHIKDDIEGEWLWIDDSESLGELETKNIVRSKQVQNWWNDHKKHNFSINASFIAESLSKVMAIQLENQNQMMEFSKQIKSHLKLIQEYRRENISWRKNKIKEIKKEVTEGHQSRLDNFI